MIRFKVSAGVAALAVSLITVLAPVEAENAFAQQAPAVESASHTQPGANQIVPTFVTREIVQPLASQNATDTPKADSLGELVASMMGDAELDEQMACLAGAIYFEARGEPLTGQLAVAEVVVNRAASGRFPASYCGVVLQKAQFSFVKRGRMPEAPSSSPAWQRAKAIAQIAHRGLWESKAEGSLYFHANYVAPSWGKRRQAMARISNHVFYK